MTCRQCELKRRAGTVVIGGPQPPAMSINDRTANRESHAHTTGLSGKERSEQPIYIFWINSAARILNSNQHLVRVKLVRAN